MMRLRAFWPGLLLGLVLAASFVSDVRAQSAGQGGFGGPGGGMGGPGGGRRGQGANPNRAPIPDNSVTPRGSDPEASDAVGLYSRLCVSIRGDRQKAIGIVGEGDTAIQKLEPAELRGLENGESGGIGWIIRMPLGEKLLLEYPPDGSCIVRAPRIKAGELEADFRNLLDQYSASGQFEIRRLADQTKVIEPPKSARGDDQPEEDHRHTDNKPKYHLLAYAMSLPDTGNSAELLVATTDSATVSIQGVLTFSIRPAGNAAH